MISFTPRGLKAQTHDRLRDNGQNARQLVLIHSGLVVVLSLITSGLNIYLDEQIGSTGGLGGLGTRSMLQTLQTMLQYGTSLFSPFWSAGFTMVTMIWASDRRPDQKDLLYGFRRFTSVLSYELLLGLMTFFLMMGTGYISGLLFSLTPYSDALFELITPFVESGIIDLSQIPMDQLLSAYTPFMLMWMAVFIPAIIIFLYNRRLSIYLILDHPQMGALRAMATSTAFMRGRKRQLFKLDLSFWWYYLLEFILVLVCYLDVILPLLGVSLPFNATIGYFVFLALYGVLQLGLHLWKKAEIGVTYALAYQFITHPDHNEPAEEV